MSIRLHHISEKLEQGERLSFDDGVWLFYEADLFDLGRLADRANRRKNGTDVFYNINRHINPTNVCVKSCKFCAFSRKPGEEGAYEYSLDEIKNKAREALSQGATEVHMVGGLHPRWRYSYFLEILRTLKAEFPELHIKAFTAVEIDWLAAKARKSIRETLLELKEAGLGSMPGGGAEIFHPDIRSRICDTKTDAERWIEIHRTAHSIGLRSNATMLYGHIESYEHRVDHMIRLRALQDETSGFNVFIPLSFQPFENEMGIKRYTKGADDLRTIAVARLMLDNFKHIKSYWIMLGQEIAQIALDFGANDLDGTVSEEKISRMAGGRAGMAMDIELIHDLIRKSQHIAVERDTLYHEIKRAAPKPTSTERLALKASEFLDEIHQLSLDPVGNANALTEKLEPLPLHELQRLVAHIEPDLDWSKRWETPLISTHALSVDWLLSDQVANFSAEMGKGDRLLCDLSELSERGSIELQASDLIRRLERLRNVASGATISILGIKGLWFVARQTNLELFELIQILCRSGVSELGSSPRESEGDLTSTEVLHFHETCHDIFGRESKSNKSHASLNFGTHAKIELSASYSGAGEAFWYHLIKRAAKFAHLGRTTGMMHSISVEIAPDSFVTAHEYLRALAITKILAPDIGMIIAPYAKLPSMRARGDYLHSETPYTDPALKIVDLAIKCGASHFGFIDRLAVRFSKCLTEELAGSEPSASQHQKTVDLTRVFQPDVCSDAK